jgi:hypothetical protein
VLQHKGLLGHKLGVLTPVLVVGFNWIWGLAALVWLRLTAKS